MSALDKSYVACRTALTKWLIPLGNHNCKMGHFLGRACFTALQKKAIADRPNCLEPVALLIGHGSFKCLPKFDFDKHGAMQKNYMRLQGGPLIQTGTSTSLNLTCAMPAKHEVCTEGFTIEGKIHAQPFPKPEHFTS